MLRHNDRLQRSLLLNLLRLARKDLGQFIEPVADRIFKDDIQVENAPLHDAVSFTHMFDGAQLGIVDGIEVAHVEPVLVKAVEAELLDRRVVVTVKGQRAIVADHAQCLHQANPIAANCLNRHIDPFAFGDLIDRSDWIGFIGIDNVSSA